MDNTIIYNVCVREVPSSKMDGFCGNGCHPRWISCGLAASSGPGVVNVQHPDPSFVANLAALLGGFARRPCLDNPLVKGFDVENPFQSFPSRYMSVNSANQSVPLPERRGTTPRSLRLLWHSFPVAPAAWFRGQGGCDENGAGFPFDKQNLTCTRLFQKRVFCNGAPQTVSYKGVSYEFLGVTFRKNVLRVSPKSKSEIVSTNNILARQSRFCNCVVLTGFETTYFDSS